MTTIQTVPGASVAAHGSDPLVGQAADALLSCLRGKLSPDKAYAAVVAGFDKTPEAERGSYIGLVAGALNELPEGAMPPLRELLFKLAVHGADAKRPEVNKLFARINEQVSPDARVSGSAQNLTVGLKMPEPSLRPIMLTEYAKYKDHPEQLAQLARAAVSPFRTASPETRAAIQKFLHAQAAQGGPEAEFFAALDKNLQEQAPPPSTDVNATKKKGKATLANQAARKAVASQLKHTKALAKPQTVTAPKTPETSKGQAAAEQFAKGLHAYLEGGREEVLERQFRVALDGLGGDKQEITRFLTSVQSAVARLTHGDAYNKEKVLRFFISGMRDEAKGGSEALFKAYEHVAKQLSHALKLTLPMELDAPPKFGPLPKVLAQLQTVEDAKPLEPAARNEHLHDDTSLKNITGPLFHNGVSYDDITQGKVGDCFFIAAASSLAKTQPGVIRKAITQEQELPDGTAVYAVRFYPIVEGKAHEVVVRVTAKAFYDRGFLGMGAEPKYAHSTRSDSADKAEMWPMILEKAYAKYVGSYEKIADGGISSDVVALLLGRTPSHKHIADMSDSELTQQLESLHKKHLPICFGSQIVPKKTGQKAESDLGEGLVANHAYSVIGVRTDDKGQVIVRVRNPWGHDGNHSGNGEQDLTLAQVRKYFENFYSVKSG